MENRRSEKALRWNARIQQWKASGLSGYAWCRQTGVSYKNFGYWRKRLCSSLKQPSHFFELPPNKSDCIGLKLELGGINLTIDHEFDEECLLRVLRALRRL